MTAVLETDADDLRVLAEKIPESVKRRFLERPDAFRRLAALDDKTLDVVMAQVGRKRRTLRKKPR